LSTIAALNVDLSHFHWHLQVRGTPHSVLELG